MNKAKYVLPDPNKLVIVFDHLANPFIGYVDEEGNWWVSVYHGEDKPLTNAIAKEWKDIK